MEEIQEVWRFERSEIFLILFLLSYQTCADFLLHLKTKFPIIPIIMVKFPNIQPEKLYQALIKIYHPN